MWNGIGAQADPTIEFGLAGQANNRPGYYHWDYHNFAPRISFAYNPRPNTVIRAGASIVYDRVGTGLLSTFDRYGAFGLSTGLTNSFIPSADTAPRLTSLTEVPCCTPGGTNIFLCRRLRRISFLSPPEEPDWQFTGAWMIPS